MPVLAPQPPASAVQSPAGTRWTLGRLCYAALWLAVFGSAAAARFRLPQTPLLDADYRGYLEPALSLLNGHGFPHIYGRDSLYPGFIYLVLRLFGDFRAIGVVQHLLGLLTGGLLLVASHRGVQLLRPVGNGPARGAPFLGLLLAAVYLSAPSAILFEQCIRPEGVFPMMALGSICLNLAFIRHRWVALSPSSAAWLGAAEMIVSCLAYKLKPSFGMALLFVNLPMLVSLLVGGVSVRSKLGMLVGGGVFCALVLVWPENILKRGDPDAVTFLPDTLVTIHADQIRDQLAEDLAADRPAPFPRATLQALFDRLEATLPASRLAENHPYPSLGFNPDYLLYTDPVFKGVLRRVGSGVQERAALGYYCYRRTWLHHPGRMLAKIWGQLRLFYHFGTADHSPVFGKGAWRRSARLLELPDDFQRNVDLFRKPGDHRELNAYPPAAALLAKSQELAQRPLVIAQPPVLTLAQRILEWLYLPALLATLLGAGWVTWIARLRAGWLLPISVTLLLFSYNFGNNLTIAVVHSLDVQRYVDNQLCFTLLASAFSLLLLGEILRRLLGNGWTVPASTGSRDAPWLDAAFPLPALAVAESPQAPPSLCVLLSRTTTGSPAFLAYRAMFPEAVIIGWDHTAENSAPTPPSQRCRAQLSALTQENADLVLLVNGATDYPAEGARCLFDSYSVQPADLLIGTHPAEHAAARAAQEASTLMRLVCGWSIANPASGLRLVSRRLYENVPLPSRGLDPDLEWTLQALEHGFEVRELPVPFMPFHLGAQPRFSGRAKRALRLLFVLGRDHRPLRCCSLVAGVIFLLSLWPLLASAHGRQRHGTCPVLSLWLSFGLVTLSLVTLQTGVLLEAGLRRARQATQWRIYTWMRSRLHPGLYQ